MSWTILVVDDEPLIRQSLQQALRSATVAVSVAGSQAEALQRFRTDQPDLVLLDLVLGEANGLDVLEQMKKEAPETKVIIMSAYGSIETAVAAMKLGGYDFLKKPYELEQIVACVRNALHTNTLERRVQYLAQKDRRQPELGAY